ncbi:uncharacterized protein [Littorina saxatilis]|uniref:uncharacterized protein isoform X2 n=1 Tax=Littorina saxatilis TaxID=31220 RepID=UPI0038B4E356
MDVDSSSKFIGSLTKFLQSLCNGYVEFQRGVELVGHIYLSIDTGEKVDYILHEKVSKNDENSVTFVSNSFHAQPLDKDKAVADKESLIKFGAKGSEDASGDDSDDIMILDQSKGVPGSTNAGTIPFKGTKRVASPSSDQRRLAQRGYAGPVRNQGSSNPMSPPRNRQLSGPSATVTSHGGQSENINVGDMKLEQITTDELLSLASQVGEGASSSNLPPRGPVRVGRSSLGDAAGQPVWIKQEPPDDRQGGPDTGWSHSRDGQSDSSNSGSNLYPVMMHPNASAYSSNPVFPGFPSMSGPSATATSQHHGLSQPLPGTSGANPYANLMPGTSGSVDPAAPLYSPGDSFVHRHLAPRSSQQSGRPRHSVSSETRRPQHTASSAAGRPQHSESLASQGRQRHIVSSAWSGRAAYSTVTSSGPQSVLRGSWNTQGQLYREKLKHCNPERYAHFKKRQREACRRYREKRRLQMMGTEIATSTEATAAAASSDFVLGPDTAPENQF